MAGPHHDSRKPTASPTPTQKQSKHLSHSPVPRFSLDFFFFFPSTLVAQTVKNLPAMQETQVRSLGREDPLEEKMATHFSIPAWGIP